MVKPEKNSKLLESVATKLKDDDFQQSLEGLSEQEKSKKEFNKLFGAFNLRSVQLEEMWVNLLKFKIIETSDWKFSVFFRRKISYGVKLSRRLSRTRDPGGGCPTLADKFLCH